MSDNTTGISMKHVSIYLSLHHLLGAMESDIVGDSFDTSEWSPLFTNYAYLLQNGTIVKRLPQHEADDHCRNGEVVNIRHMLEDIAVGRRRAPAVSPAFAF
jgi:hypothetical protein